MPEQRAVPTLVITADDYGYRPAYNRGILEAARMGAVDAASAMVERQFCDPGPLLGTGVEIGLHLELPESVGPGAAQAGLSTQLDAFERAFGRPPAYLDGHKDCHAATMAVAAAIARMAADRGLPVRSIDEPHRRLLRGEGVPTPDRLVGRIDPTEPAPPWLLASALDGSAAPPPGVTEWMVHPGYRDPRGGSSYDEARELDLRLVLDLADELRRLFARRSHREALTLDAPS
jgi:predicted glycoside hydrolase/deacetylase ChbG (UPF0249 family)